MKGKAAANFSKTLLTWYDAHARAMPWRTSPADRKAGIRPDPYHVWLSEIMLQQTTVAAVGPYFRKFVETWPNIDALAAAPDADIMAAWAGLGYYSRARNLLKCARQVVDSGQPFPSTQTELQKLPGIGPYTSGAIAAIAFDEPAPVVDGNVERVMARLYLVETPLPAAKPDLTALATGLTPQTRPGDYAQAVMDLGATICTPRNPKCLICPVAAFCKATKAGCAADLPRKTSKAQKPTRFGDIYVAFIGKSGVVVEQRPDKGLLGGMIGFPGTVWAENRATPAPTFPANWSKIQQKVQHVFTHFRLELTVHTTQLPKPPDLPSNALFVADPLDPNSLPTVMRKAHAAAHAERMAAT